MTKITIHGQKMQYHKVTAISVTLTSGTGGTATFTPAAGTSYTLSSLPIGTRIAKSTDTLYSLSDANGNSVGTITLVASSGYNADEVSITRGGVKTTIGIVPIVLQEGDSIVADFEAITMRIKFYNNGLGTFYNNLTGESIPDGGYADVPRADALRFSPSGTNDGAIEIFKDGLWTPTIIYMYNGQQAYILAYPSSAGQVQPVEFAPEPGTTYEFPSMWNLQSGYQYLDGSTFALQNSPMPACEFVRAQDVGFNPGTFFDSFQQNAGTYFQNRYGCSDFQILDCAPRNFDYVLSSDLLGNGGEKTGMCWCAISVRDRDNMKYTGEGYVIYNNVGGSTYFNFINSDGNLSGLNVPQWSSTNLTPISTNTLGLIFEYDDTNQIDYWKQSWGCANECELANTLIQLLNY